MNKYSLLFTKFKCMKKMLMLTKLFIISQEYRSRHGLNFNLFQILML